jgi:hypothetical protein
VAAFGINTKMARKVGRRVWPVLVRKLDILRHASISRMRHLNHETREGPEAL